MIYNETSLILKTGYKCVALSAGLVLLMVLLDGDIFALLAMFLFLMTLWAYRNPERVPPRNEEKTLVSVADGRIKSVTLLPSTEGKERFEIVIKSSCLDASILRAPFSARVQAVHNYSGARLSASSPLASKLNAQSHLVFTCEGAEVEVVHTLQITPKAIMNDLNRDAHVVQGMRYGVMLKGETSIYLPKTARVAVNRGDKVRAGETILGLLA